MTTFIREDVAVTARRVCCLEGVCDGMMAGLDFSSHDTCRGRQSAFDVVMALIMMHQCIFHSMTLPMCRFFPIGGVRCLDFHESRWWPCIGASNPRCPKTQNVLKVWRFDIIMIGRLSQHQAGDHTISIDSSIEIVRDTCGYGCTDRLQSYPDDRRDATDNVRIRAMVSDRKNNQNMNVKVYFSERKKLICIDHRSIVDFKCTWWKTATWTPPESTSHTWSRHDNLASIFNIDVVSYEITKETNQTWHSNWIYFDGTKETIKK